MKLNSTNAAELQQSVIRTHKTSQPPAMFLDGKFHNQDTSVVQDMSKLGSILWRYMTEKRIAAIPEYPVPVEVIPTEALQQSVDTLIYRLGHSSILMNFSGETWLIDPVFSKRASPVQWAGPARFHQPPISLKDLPSIQGVVISHNHYDHLDYDTIRQIHTRVAHFVVPMGVKHTLIKWGVDPDKVQELNWWQTTHLGKLAITATPAQHFSGRGLTDTDQSLWASWVFKSESANIFYSGDSGYFDGFKQIGEQFGPFDITLMETGAYDKDWPDIHMHPQQTLQAHIDLRGKRLLPVHNSTFDLAMHPWYEPLEQLVKLASASNEVVLTPVMGAPIRLNELQQAHVLENQDHQQRWWRQLDPNFVDVIHKAPNNKDATQSAEVLQPVS